MQTRLEIRSSVGEAVALLARGSEQQEYEKNVPHVSVPSELVEIFVSDVYNPKSHDFVDAFTEIELKLLARLYGHVCIASQAMRQRAILSVTDLQKLPIWREVMKFAKQMRGQMSFETKKPNQALE